VNDPRAAALATAVAAAMLGPERVVEVSSTCNGTWG
jgi:hypothetical protein